MGRMHGPGTEAAVFSDVIAQIQTTEQANELIRHLESEIKKSKSPALKRRLIVALDGTKQRKLQLQTAVPVKKTRPQKPKQLYVGLDRKITDQRPFAIPPREREDEEDPDNSYE
jgi:hypothetical protein